MKLRKFGDSCCTGTLRFFFGACCFKRERRARQALHDSQMGYLDIERLIRSQVNLADFLRSYLNIQ